MKVNDGEKAALIEQLRASSQKNIDNESFFKVNLLLLYIGLTLTRSISKEYLISWRNEECF
jgi:hypothetical protein